MANSTNIQLPLLEAAQAQKHVTVNDGLQALDAIVQLSVKDRDLTAPPGSPVDGDRYIAGPSATGAWASQDSNVAAYQDGVWRFYNPRAGWRCWVEDEGILLIHDGSAWVATALSSNGIDMDGNEIILDADGDTSITADTDDQIDFRVGGADRASLTASRLQVAIDGGDAFEVLRASSNPSQLLMRSQINSDFTTIGENRFTGRNSAGSDFLYCTFLGNIAQAASGNEYGSFAVNMAYGGNDADSGATSSARLSVWSGAAFPPPNISFNVPISAVGEIGYFAVKGKDSAGNAPQDYGSLRWSIVSNTSGSESGQIEIKALHGGSGRSFKFQNGAQFGAPTGGFKGDGTLNAKAVYDDNVVLTCYGFAQENEGFVDAQEWDSYAPDTHIPAKEFIARQEAFDQSDPDQYASFWKTHGHFPNLPGRSKDYDHARDKLSVGECGQKLIEVCEMQAIHIEKLNQRLKKLEEK